MYSNRIWGIGILVLCLMALASTQSASQIKNYAGLSWMPFGVSPAKSDSMMNINCPGATKTDDIINEANVRMVTYEGGKYGGRETQKWDCYFTKEGLSMVCVDLPGEHADLPSIYFDVVRLLGMNLGKPSSENGRKYYKKLKKAGMSDEEIYDGLSGDFHFSTTWRINGCIVVVTCGDADGVVCVEYLSLKMARTHKQDQDAKAKSGM